MAKEIEIEIEKYPLTCVSGYWSIKNKHGDKFLQWFKTSLRVNCPYVFFSDKKGIELIKQFRTDLPTHYIECNIEQFYTYQYKDKILPDPLHCPSVELNLIWHEKLCLLEKAHKLNLFNSEFFCWVDAGLCVYREKPPSTKPFPNLDKLNRLPTDKFIYSTSVAPYQSKLVASNSYYHYIAGSAYILPARIIYPFVQQYKAYLSRIFNDPIIRNMNIWTDQVVLTHIFKKFSHKFYKVGDGYGQLMLDLA